MKTFGNYVCRFGMVGLAVVALGLVGCANRGSPPGAGSGASMAYQTQQPKPVAAMDAQAIDAEAAAIFSGKHGQLPPLQAVQRDPNSRVAEIVTRNDTPYGIVLLYSGPTSQRITLGSRESGTLRIEPGDYLVTVKAAPGSNVSPFGGRQRIEGGRYQSSWYIETTRR